MSADSFETTGRSTIERLPSRGSYDRKKIFDILDDGILCHVGMTTDSGLDL